MSILLVLSLSVAAMCMYVAGESFAVGNRKGGWVCLVMAVLNAGMAVLNMSPHQ